MFMMFGQHLVIYIYIYIYTVLFLRTNIIIIIHLYFLTETYYFNSLMQNYYYHYT